MAIWLSLLLKYFTLDHKALGLDIIRRVLGANFSSKLSPVVMVLYAGIAYQTLPQKVLVEHMIFTAAVYLLTDLGPRYAPKSLTFSESFTLSTLVVLYADFSLKQLLAPVVSSVGSPTLNAAIFLPWVGLLAGLAFTFLLRPILGTALACGTATIAFHVATGAFLATRPDMVARLLRVVLDPLSLNMTGYLASTLAIGLFVLYDLSAEPESQMLRLGLRLDNLTHRKLFHVLALLLYTPMHAAALKERRMFEFLTLS